jgi:phosphatidylserine decarboxylase
MDGWPFVVPAAALSVLAGVFLGRAAALPFLVLAGWVAWFFRDPERTVPEDAKAVVAPADGRVIDVRKVPYPRLLEGEATRVSIFMSVFNVHVNRAPFDGTVREVDYHPGKFFAAYAEKASLENEQSGVVIDTPKGSPILFVQIAGWVARRVVNRLNARERVARGERFGLIRFGSRCDIYLPANVDVWAEVGQKTKAGESVIGVFR